MTMTTRTMTGMAMLTTRKFNSPRNGHKRRSDCQMLRTPCATGSQKPIRCSHLASFAPRAKSVDPDQSPTSKMTMLKTTMPKTTPRTKANQVTMA